MTYQFDVIHPDDTKHCPKLTDFHEILHGDGSYNIENPDLKVTDAEEITIKFDYPLRAPIEFKFRRPGGWTQKALFGAVVAGYEEIFREDNPAPIPDDTEVEVPGLGPMTFVGGIMRKMDGDGKYGVWGHAFDQLWFEGYDVVRPDYIELTMGS